MLATVSAGRGSTSRERAEGEGSVHRLEMGKSSGRGGMPSRSWEIYLTAGRTDRLLGSPLGDDHRNKSGREGWIRDRWQGGTSRRP